MAASIFGASEHEFSGILFVSPSKECVQGQSIWNDISLIVRRMYRLDIMRIESNGFLYYILYHTLWLNKDPGSDLSMRMIAIISGCLSVIGTWYLANCLAVLSGRAAKLKHWGTYSAFVLAANGAFMAFSIHNRFYSFNMLMVVFATIALLKLVQNNNRLWLIIYITPYAVLLQFNDTEHYYSASAYLVYHCVS